MGTQGRRIDEQTRCRVVKLAEQGVPKVQVARIMNINRDTVRLICKERAERRRS